MIRLTIINTIITIIFIKKITIIVEIFRVVCHFVWNFCQVNQFLKSSEVTCIREMFITLQILNNVLNPYLRHFGNVMERYLWTKNPQSHYWFWWRHMSIKNFYFMLIWNLLSCTNCTPLGLITWRHYPEISCDEHKCTWKPENMVERHLWTKNPQLFFTRIIFTELF